MEPKKVEVKTHIDDRGFIYQVFDIRNSKISFDGKTYLNLPTIKRVYIVGNFSKGVIRGMHFHKKEWKFFFVISGSAKFVISKSSKPGKETKTFILSSKKPEILIVPPTYYNGWTALEDNTILIGMSNFCLRESLKDDFRISPDDFIELFMVRSR